MYLLRYAFHRPFMRNTFEAIYCSTAESHRILRSRSVVSFLSWIFLTILFSPALIQAAQVTLAWDANDPTPIGYRLYQRTEGSSYNYTQPAWTGSETTCTLCDIEEGIQYYYVVRAYDNSSESGDSNEASYYAAPTNTEPVSNAPRADAGADQTVAAWSTVTLNGSGSSDPDGDSLGHSWAQTGGPTVQISNTTVEQPTFTAPESATTDMVMTFRLTVTDPGGQSAVDTCTVTVPAEVVRNTPTAADTGGAASEPANQIPISQGNVTEFIIDNGEPGTSFSGEWHVSGGANPWDPSDPGAMSLWSRDGATYTWTFTPTDTGNHDVSMWWTEWRSRSTNIPVDIEHAGGTNRVFINQRNDGGQWNYLATYVFEAGVPYDITITSQAGPSSTCADAVQFNYQPSGNIAPVAVIDSVTPNPAGTEDLITFEGHGTDPDGTIASFRWSSDIDGLLYNSASFTTAVPLSQGTHTISFTVTDNGGAASEPATQTLVVQKEVTEFIIDDGDSGTSFTGEWRLSGGLNPWNPTDPDPVSLWSRGGAAYTWSFTPATSGNYDVSMWWTEWSSRSNSVPVAIAYAGGTATVVLNQRINGGRWNSFGTYPFQAGVSYDVTLTSQPAPASTCADAVKFTLAGTVNLPPDAVIDVITPPATFPGDEVSFIGSGFDDDGSVVAYEWFSDIDGFLSSQDSFSTSALSQGTHTVFLRVRDDQGAWSDNKTALVVIRDCGTPVAVMPLGDSITRGYGEIMDGDLMTGYRALLHQRLVADGYHIDFVGNRLEGQLVVPPYDINHQGIGGISAGQVASSIYNWLAENPAEVILMHVGTNAFTTAPSAVAAILDEIDRYENDTGMTITVILARIINRNPYHSPTTVFNDNVEAMAETRIAAGDKIVLVDQESALNYATDMWDELHPNNQGYARMPSAWYDEIIGLLPVCATFEPFIFTSPFETAGIGAAYTYQAAATGIPAPTYSLSSAPAGMTIDATTGQISWVPVAGQEGSHAVSVAASNSEGTTVQDFTVEIGTDPIIIDNGDLQTSFTGIWKVSGGTNPYDPADPGATSAWSRNGDTYKWIFTPPSSGTYQFSMWWTQWSSRSTSVPVNIEHAGGMDTLLINQRINGGQWNILGSYSFIAGRSYTITIVSQPGPTSTCADAVRFVKK